MSIEPKFDCEYVRNIVCPHCGSTMEDAWEVEFDDECIEIECGDCKETFGVTKHESVTYSSYCLEHDFQDDGTEAHPDKQTCTRCGEIHFKRFDEPKT